jgi:mono/diheme cytochrome c family protein
MGGIMRIVRKIFKWLGIVMGGLIGLLIIGAVVVVLIVSSRRNQTYDVQSAGVAIPTDSESIARGEHVVRSVAGCWGCHGEDLGGMVLLDDPMIMTLYAPNLTQGQGGAAATFSPEDWDRAVRHGIGPDGKPVLLMPAQNFRFMTDEDLGNVIAYIKSLAPVDKKVPEPRLGPMGYVLGLTEPSFVPAAMFDHTQPSTASIEPSVTAKYGEYLVWLGQCHDCHGPNLSGRQLPLPGEPPSRNLTPGGELAGWSQQDFINTIRTGVTPSGDALREPMAGVLKGLQGQSDDELAAIYLYLKSLPALKFGT